jgi:hypothetical protein
MRWLATEPRMARRIGENAAEWVTQYHGPAYVASMYIDALNKAR